MALKSELIVHRRMGIFQDRIKFECEKVLCSHSIKASMVFSSDRGGDERLARKSFDWLALWLLVSTWCTASGWLLSLFGYLNLQGYFISILLFTGLIWFYRKELGFFGSKIVFARVWPFHPGQWLPKAWLILAFLVFIGGLIYHPNNYDYLSYRFARILHWLWTQHWYWIDTPNRRMNLTAPGFEWLMAPLFVFFKTDRLFFLLNIVSFLLLPGVIFSCFYRLGISRRIAWWWMWLLPCGYCYALQAGSAGNDLFSAVYTLASFLYILKTGEDRSASSRNFFYSCIAIALATDSKASNLPLVLPWLMVVFLQRDFFWRMRPVLIAGIFFLAAGVSFLPLALLNIHFTGVYTGDPHNESHMQLDSPVGGLTGNLIMVGVDNFRPPIWPTEVSLNNELPGPLKDYLKRVFPRFDIGIDQIQIEESGGVGVGISLCLLLMVGLKLWYWKTHFAGLNGGAKKRYLPALGAVWLGMFALLAKLGNEGAARLLTPYYALLIAGILVVLAVNGAVTRLKICSFFAAGAFAISILLVVISPARPLFPTRLATSILARISPSHAARMERVYGVYGSRYDAMKDIRLLLPDSEKAVGFIQHGDNLEAPLWLPYGSRQIVDVSPEQTPDQLKAEHIHLVVTSDNGLLFKYGMTIDDLTKKWSATVLAKKEMVLRAAQGPENCYIVALP
jgi:hypothetical protein